MYWRTIGLAMLMGSHITLWRDSVFGVSRASPAIIAPNMTADAMDRPMLWNHRNQSMVVFLGQGEHCWSSQTNPMYIRGDAMWSGEESGSVNAMDSIV